MTKLTKLIDEELDYSQIMDEKTPQGVAVDSLINVKKSNKSDLETDIELKTELDDSEVKMHTAVELMGSVLDFTEDDLMKRNLVIDLVNKLERKALSKSRASRNEIVTLARAPDMMFPQLGGNMDMNQQQPRSRMRSLFRSRRRM